uniref:Uncharacterized protein n=1 Tax=Anguilla anguilla TaxID=7936 RepID=A0A0E9SNT2_ANGAN
MAWSWVISVQREGMSAGLASYSLANCSLNLLEDVLPVV